MRKFSKKFRGVRKGEFYPVWFAPGDECPVELVAGAESLGVLADADNQVAEGDLPADGQDVRAGEESGAAGAKVVPRGTSRGRRGRR